MAKVNGPFMSLSASGQFAKTLVASIWKGRPYMRQLVIPANPRTAGQQNVRAILGVIAKAATAVLTSFMDVELVGSPYFTAARDAAPSGQSWISYLQKSLYSLIADNTIFTAWDALGATKKGYFENTGADVSLVDYMPSWHVGEMPLNTAGQQLFALAYFASNFLSGDVKVAADLAIAGASQGDVDAFGDIVHLTTL